VSDITFGCGKVCTEAYFVVNALCFDGAEFHSDLWSENQAQSTNLKVAVVSVLVSVEAVA
jgi:hypothetical protein